MNIARKDGALSGKWTSEIELQEAIALQTGVQFHPNMEDAHWRELAARIQSSPYTPFEYVYYVAHHEEVSGLTGSHNLIKKNFVCHESTWDRFLDFKSDREYDVSLAARLQFDQAEMYVNSYMPKMRILTERFAELNSLIRIELALQWKDEIDSQVVIDLYYDEAELQLRGNPEYAPYVPLFQQLKKEVDGRTS